jgi:hypothetical protein
LHFTLKFVKKTIPLKKKKFNFFSNFKFKFMGFDIDNYLERCYKGELLEELVIKLICLKLKEIFIHEPNIKYLKAPVTVVGDVHGFVPFISFSDNLCL